jgi:hypothetical protein
MKVFGSNRKLFSGTDTYSFSNSTPGALRFAFLAAKFVFRIPIIPAYVDPLLFGGMKGSDGINYQQMINDKEQNPRKIKSIRILTTDFSQYANPFEWNFTDSNGQSFQVSDQPLNMLSPNQVQSGVIDMSYENLIIGQNEFLVWTLNPGTLVTLTLTYEYFTLSSLMLDNRKQLIKKLN